jgi:hypothetical protein
MGKLAERLADLERSGVYRVETTEALEEAIACNGFAMVRIDALQRGPDWEACLTPRDDGRVLLISGSAELLQRDAPGWDALLSAITATAVEHRAAGLRFFAVFLDPDAALPVAPLYSRDKPNLQHCSQGRPSKRQPDVLFR